MRLFIGRIVFVLLLPIAMVALLMEVIGHMGFAFCEATLSLIIDGDNWLTTFKRELEGGV